MVSMVQVFLKPSRFTGCFGRCFSTKVDLIEEQDYVPYTPVKPQAWVTSLETGKNLTIMELDDMVFGRKPRLDIIQRVVVWQRAKMRAGTAKVKNRHEVRGGGKKPWPQKGLGKARQGSIRAPQWVGGGVVHGPRGNKSYDYTLPKKIRALGLCSALAVKYSQGDLYLVDSLTPPTRRTKDLLSLIEEHQWGSSILMVDGGEKVDLNLAYASQNIPKLEVLPSIGLNVYSILLRDKLVLSVGAVHCIEERILRHIT